MLRIHHTIDEVVWNINPVYSHLEKHKHIKQDGIFNMYKGASTHARQPLDYMVAERRESRREESDFRPRYLSATERHVILEVDGDSFLSPR
ncbi:hypothetical protein TNCV_2005551 [Trichonephila clavipes]|nr:hypothetical protein TNCV_2005551 [Trichonephila clavipes]